MPRATAACVLMLGLSVVRPALSQSGPWAMNQPTDGSRSVDAMDHAVTESLDAPKPNEGASDSFGLSLTPELTLFPFGVYSPETGIGLGTLMLFAPVEPRRPRPTRRRASSVALLGLVTTRRQALFELTPDLHWPRSGTHLWGKLEHQRYPDSFWGIGNGIDPDAEERYQRRLTRGRAWLKQRLASALQLGLLVDGQQYRGVYSRSGGLFRESAVPGAGGGFTMGAGPTLSWDTRDHPLAAHRGALYEAVLTHYARPLGSDYAFTRALLDLRRFTPLGCEQVFAQHLLAELEWGNVPYYQLSQLGGPDLLRGYFKGKYRDRRLLALDLEYRSPFLWRLGAAVFVGLGHVGKLDEAIDAGELRAAAGAGLRFAVNRDKRLNVRLDAAAGIDTAGAYLAIAEAF